MHTAAHARVLRRIQKRAVILTRCEESGCGKMVAEWCWVGTFKVCLDCVLLAHEADREIHAEDLEDARAECLDMAEAALTRCERPLCGKQVLDWRWSGTHKVCIDCAFLERDEAEDLVTEAEAETVTETRRLEDELQGAQESHDTMVTDIRAALDSAEFLRPSESPEDPEAAKDRVIMFEVLDKIAKILDRKP